MLRKVWDAAIQLFVAGSIFISKDLRQFAQTQIYASSWGVDLHAFPEAMTRRMEEAVQARSVENNVVSKSSKETSKLLKDIGFDHQCEIVPELALSEKWRLNTTVNHISYGSG